MKTGDARDGNKAIMSCVEKRHMSHRVGSMLHHRFPNGFTDLFMDETDREVSTLTDRAFRSLCVGDDAVYNDEFLYGYSPFSCHKPLAGDPLKKSHRKENKKQELSKDEKIGTQPWKQQTNMSQMSSFLNALSIKEESRDGLLIKNGGKSDCNGESWDQSALRSIERELSEFSSNYHSNLTDGHYKGSDRKTTGSKNKTSSEKSSKIKNGKSTVKLKKLNIKNFFLHSEFSPFQSWGAFNKFPFTQEDCSILPADNIPKWCDLPFYKELTQAHIKNTRHTEETKSCEEELVELQTPAKPVTIRAPSPPKVLPKPSITLTQKRCSSNGVDGGVAPWRRNKSRATSAVPIHESALPPQEVPSATVDGNIASDKNEGKSFEVKAVEDVSSVASTPFSICQLMTPLIPSRQPTETSEILQNVLSPSALDLPLTPHSEAKLTPEPPVKRDSYKSLASSILFNLKDNRKRVKSRYSPPKFKNVDTPESGTLSPPSSNLKPAGSEGNSSGLSTPAVPKEVQTVHSPPVESGGTPLIVADSDRPLSGDFLLSNILQTKGEAGLGELKKNRSPNVKRQNYPSLNLYKKSSPVDVEKKFLQVPSSTGAAVCDDESAVTNVNPDHSPVISPSTVGTQEPPYSGKITLNAPENVHKTMVQMEGSEPMSPKGRDNHHMTTLDVIKAAKEAITAAKNKALFAGHSENTKTNSQVEQMQENYNNLANSEEIISSKQKSLCDADQMISQCTSEASSPSATRKEPPPVPKRNFAKSDIQLALTKQQLRNSEDSKEDMRESGRQKKLKHIFSARQNNYIKNQRYSVTDEEQGEEMEQGVAEVQAKCSQDGETARDMRDNDHISYDLHALKELERARLGSRVHESMTKSGVLSIEEEARAKNDLISRELRNIKKGMLSMKGNTSAKREIFDKREKEHSKQDHFAKIDSNVIVSKALLNDNYDKAKMALEEIISERRNKTLGKDLANGCGESNASKEQESKANISSPGPQQSDPRERLGDVRDHSHIRQILSQTEPRIGETHRVGGRIPLPGMADVEYHARVKTSAKQDHYVNNVNDTNYNSKGSDVENVRQSDVIEKNESKILASPAIPPRHKKIGSRKDRRDDVMRNDGVYENSDTISVNETILAKGEEANESAKPLGSTETCLYSAETSKQFIVSDGASGGAIDDIKTQASSETGQEEAFESEATKEDIENEIPTKEKLHKTLAEEGVSETPMSVTSPLVLINGISFSPPDQASLSSKSSYFSVDSTLQRNTETESNIFHSMENLYEELLEDEKDEGNVQSSIGEDGQYYHLSNHEKEKEPLIVPQREKEIPSNILAPPSIFSPTLGIPALFKIKDNTCPQRSKKTLQPWSPRSSLSGAEKGEQEISEVKENMEMPSTEETVDQISFNTNKILPTQKVLVRHLPPSPPTSPLDVQGEDRKRPQSGDLLTVPRDEDVCSGVSPCSEGLESIATSTTETADEMGTCEATPEQEVLKIASECSGSTCSGYESQPSLPKPPMVLPKSEKAVLKAIKLTNRRMKKDEAQKSSHGSRRHKGEAHRGEKSEHRSGRGKDRKHRDASSEDSHPTRGHREQGHENSTRSQGRVETQKRSSTEKRNVDLTEPDAIAKRQGQDSNPEKELQRQLSSDQVISNVPVYKAHLSDRPVSDKPFQRSVSIDRYLADKSQRRHSEDMSVREKADPRRQRIEKSIMDELQQRGRARERTCRENPLRRSHSIDTYSTNVPQSSTQTIQSGQPEQLSRQSSIEHNIVTQAFPMTQRKLLQDPDSGQYFFVDMPVQVKTKTFYDPETGSYVQLPVQPPDGAVLQASPMEVLTPPMVVYHSFVPVPLSPMTQNSTVKNPYVEVEELRHLEKSRKINCNDPYLETLYGQHDNVLGEFLGTEELDCPS
ncbi:uncharacterized protein LOC128758492 [Synchiropus splendidus]|uniref:uncharacterized protein LOC128758492 n=1 Tax=Synchiropus splendidus TaxID=270530 RepID=UPI00237D6FFE|nr:uncharacterized protein LOC128758492 [Synchiropus splendidus]